MKRISLIAVLLCLVLSSCAAPTPPLAYQEGLLCATFDVSLGGEDFTLKTIPSENALEVVSPECLSGVRLVRGTAKYTLVADGEEFDLPLDLLTLSEGLFDMFSLSAANVENNSIKDKCIIKTDIGVFTVELSENGTPSRISFDGARDFTAENIRIEY